MAAEIDVCVAYALPERQWLLRLRLVSGARLADALDLARRDPNFPVFPNDAAVGIFGKPCDLNTQLEQGDRIEIYRPLLIDPKDARRLRAARQRGA